MNTAKKGRAKEHKVRDLLRAEGYFVMRSAGSFGPVDLIAIPTKSCKGLKVVRLIQVKPRNITGADRRELEDLRTELDVLTCSIEGWVVEDRKSPRQHFSL